MNSSRSTASRQRRTASLLRVILALGLLNLGCRGIYREAERIYPADPCARLELKLVEARQAQTQAELAATRLRDRAAKGVAAKTLEFDIDRLEMMAREFDRRMAAVVDATAGCARSDLFTAEVQLLQVRSARTLETVEIIRRDGLSVAKPLLDALLENSNSP